MCCAPSSPDRQPATYQVFSKVILLSPEGMAAFHEHLYSFLQAIYFNFTEAAAPLYPARLLQTANF